MPTYFVTGATGFIGRHLVEQLLASARARSTCSCARARRSRLDELIEGWGQPERDRAGRRRPDARRSSGSPTSKIAELRGNVDHFFHLAAIYDMTADDGAQHEAQRRRARATRSSWPTRSSAGIFHHVSSIAAAGTYKGLFREDMFDEGQKLDHPYHRTKFESEKIARTQTKGAVARLPARRSSSATRRPARWTRSTAPTTSSRRSRSCAHYLPEWVPLVGPELGYTNIVPVDFVAAAMDHIAHQPDLDGQAFHLSSPKSQRSGEVMNAFAEGRARAAAWRCGSTRA